MATQDVIQLPYRNLDPSDYEALVLAVQRNFMEVERYLSLLQLLIKQSTGGAVKDLPAKSEVWDRAANINADGTFPTEKLTDKYVGLTHTLQLVDNAVSHVHIAVNAIRDLHISAGAITVPKLNFPHHYIY